MKVERIKISEISREENVRATTGKRLNIMMSSIQNNGLLQPIGVEYTGKNSYKLVFGNRRLDAAIKLGWSSIPAVIDTQGDEKDFLVKNTIENIQRENVSPAEIGRICEQLEKKGLSSSEISARLDLPEVTIKSLLTLYKELPAKYREKVIFHKRGMKKEGTLSVDNVTRILNKRTRLGLSREKLHQLLDYTENNGLSSKDIEVVASIMGSGKTFTQSLQQSRNIKMVRLDVPVALDEVKEMASKEGVSIINYLTQVMYGLKTPVSKPHFVNFKESKKV